MYYINTQHAATVPIYARREMEDIALEVRPDAGKFPNIYAGKLH